MRSSSCSIGARAACHAALLFFAALPSAHGQPGADQAHATAMTLLNNGRPAQAYGVLVALANAGHAESARMALLLCQHGLALYGRDWDCGTFELEEWAHTARLPVPVMQPQTYGPLGPVVPGMTRSSSASRGARR